MRIYCKYENIMQIWEYVELPMERIIFFLKLKIQTRYLFLTNVIY